MLYFYLISSLLFLQNEESSDSGEKNTTEVATIDPAEALEKLKIAEKAGIETVLLESIEEFADIKDKKVIAEIATHLKHKSENIRYAALKALRFNEDPESLSRLLKFSKDKRLKTDTNYHVEYIYALGQKADKKAAKIIKDDLVMSSAVDQKILAAKVLALGRIREIDSIETLMGFTVSGGRRGGARKRGGTVPMRQEVQTSLAVLTGVELGNNAQAWNDWWNDNKRGFKISSKEGTISNARLDRRWKALWMTETEKAQAAEDAKKERQEKGKNDDKKKEKSEDGLIDF